MATDSAVKQSDAGTPATGDPTFVVIAGPPCAGKTSYAQNHAQPGDLIVDIDTICIELGSPSRWLHPDRILHAATLEADRRIAHHREHGTGTAWIIRSLPNSNQRTAFARTLNARLITLDPGQHECLRRAATRPTGTRRAINLWYWKAKGKGR